MNSKQDSFSTTFKIFFIGLNDPIPTFIRRRIESLSSMGIEVSILFPYNRSCDLFIPNVIVIPHFKIKTRIELLMILMQRIAFLPKIFSLFLQLNQFSIRKRLIFAIECHNLLNLKFDLAHFQWIAHVAAFDHLIGIWKKPVVSSVRGSMVTIYPHKDTTYRQLLEKSFALSTAVHCVSDSLMQVCKQDFGVPVAKLFVNYNGINIDKFAPGTPPLPAAKERLRLISVGALMWRKNYPMQLLLMKGLNRPDVELVIVGEGEDLHKLQYQTKVFGLENQVHFLSKKPEHEVINLLQGSDIYISTSLAEGLANSVMEAAACGLPVVATECEGMREIILEGQSGFVVPSGDLSAMGEKINLLLDDPNLRSVMGAAGRQWVVDRFNADDHVQQMVEHYQSLKQQHEK